MQYQPITTDSPLTSTSGYGPKIIAAPSGNFFTFDTRQIQLFDTSGHVLGDAFTLNLDPTFSHTTTAFTPLAGGEFAETFVDHLASPPGSGGSGSSQVGYQLFDRSGVAIGIGLTLATAIDDPIDGSSGTISGAAIAGLADGNFVVSWIESDHAIQYAEIDATGAVLSEGEGADATTYGNPVVTGLANGSFAIGAHVSGSYFGEIVSGTMNASFSITEQVDTIELDGLTNGDVLAAWTYDGIGHAQLFDPAGTRVGNEITVATGSRAFPVFSATALTERGFLLTWTVTQSDGTAGIEAQTFDGSANSTSDAFIIASTTGAVQMLDATKFANGGFAIDWTELVSSVQHADEGLHFAPVFHARFFQYQHAAKSGDFNGDGHSDILWRNDDGNFTEWQVTGNSGQLIPNTYGNASVGTDWHIAETFDFNGDGLSDILWHNDSTGMITVWEGTAGGGFVENAYVSIPFATDWSIAATGDFNGDGRDDLVWLHPSTGDVTTQLSSDVGFVPAADYAGIPLSYKIVGTGDFNGDGKADLLWRDQATGQFTTWTSNVHAFDTNVYTDSSVGTDWHVKAIADFDGDGKSDLLWRNGTNGEFTIWTSTGTGFTPNTYVDTSVSPDWQIAQTGDFNDDGKADILWRNATAGTFTLWQSNGHGFDENVVVQAGVSTDWHVQGHDYLYG